MITIRKLEENEFEHIKSFLENEGLELYCYNFDADNIHIGILDSNSLLGLSKVYMPSNDISIIQWIYISEKQRGEGLGDSIFRSTIHYLSTKEYNSIFIEESKGLEDFLNKRKHGLFECSNELNNIKRNSNNKIYKCNPNILLKSRCSF